MGDLTQLKPDECYVTEHYDVRAWNGLVIGRVEAAAEHDGAWFFLITLLSGERAGGIAAGEHAPFVPFYGDPLANPRLAAALRALPGGRASGEAHTAPASQLPSAQPEVLFLPPPAHRPCKPS